jgi:glycosyltransferase-like protein
VRHRPIALLTYSTKPRGGVVHTLEVAEALHDLGVPVRVVALGDPSTGFFRPVRVPVTLVPGPVDAADLEEKVAGSIDCIEQALLDIVRAAPETVLHAQDCISARAAARVRDAGHGVPVVRTVHHVDDFSSQILMDCQRQAILEPDVVLAVTEVWRGILSRDYGIRPGVVPNGVDVAKYAADSRERATQLRRAVGAQDRPLVLAVGGLEPRKGSVSLVRALAQVRDRSGLTPVLAVLGGHSFQDYRAYRDAVLAELPDLGLELGRDVVEVGTVPEDDMAAWYGAADVLAFPSVKEGFGLAVLEAMSAGLPVVTSDLPVFREYLVPDRDALLVGLGDVEGLAGALLSVLQDEERRASLVRAGRAVAERFTWQESARRHLAVYAGLEQRTSQPVDA